VESCSRGPDSGWSTPAARWHSSPGPWCAAAVHVSSGSKTVLTPLKWGVCITPESRHRSATLPIAIATMMTRNSSMAVQADSAWPIIKNNWLRSESLISALILSMNATCPCAYFSKPRKACTAPWRKVKFPSKELLGGSNEATYDRHGNFPEEEEKERFALAGRPPSSIRSKNR
jgi:hypothetical protein